MFTASQSLGTEFIPVGSLQYIQKNFKCFFEALRTIISKGNKNEFQQPSYDAKKKSDKLSIFFDIQEKLEKRSFN